MIKRTSLLLILILTAVAANAESPWEIRLPGEPLLPLDAHSLALGGATEARWDIKGGLPANSAQIANLDGFTFATVLQWRQASRTLAAGESWSETRQDFPAFQISANLPKGIRLGIGFRADMRARGSFTLPMIQIEGQDCEQSYTQKGGYHRFPLSIAMPIGDKVRLGLGVSLVRGHLNQEWYFRFPDALVYENPELGFVNRSARRLASWHGTSFNAGLLVRPLKWLSVSGRLESACDVNGDNTIQTAGIESEEVDPISGRMPARWGLGLAGNLGDSGILSVQWDHEEWADCEMPVGDIDLLNVDRIAAGFEWIFRYGYRNKKETPLRIGFRSSNHPGPDPFTRAEINEKFYSIGTGINLRDGRGSVDLTLFLQNLTVAGGETEKRIGVALSVRTSEIWTKRTTPF
ncbi:MAG: hypothetical protein GY835_17490 [bacterium]|nr:hypothetical protein [bacterium]